MIGADTLAVDRTSKGIGRQAVLSVQGLSVEFGPSGNSVYAVNDVSFDLAEGESLAIVGESGSGKSVTVQTLMGLIRKPPGRVTAGRALFRGRDLLAMPDRELRQIRGRDIAMIFQDPMSSLNPVLTIGLQLTEALREHQGLNDAEAERQALDMLALVGIANAPQRMRAFPHQFSGGQLQRIGIAMALVCKPSMLIADEPTTALDVTIQAQIVELVVRLQKQLGMAIIWISHDLSLVAGFVDRVAVMYAGSIVESAPVGDLFSATKHPYTIGLLNSIPSLTAANTRLVPIKGAPPNVTLAPTFCAFAPRCDHAEARCRQARPPLEAAGADHTVACWRWREVERGPRTGAGAADKPAVTAPKQEALLTVTDLKVHFPIRRGVLRRQVGAVHAVDGVSFEVMRGETLALVGESGCGKSTTGRAVLGLERPSAGSIVFEGRNYAGATGEELKQRRRDMQMVFQNPFGSLNPRMTVGRIIGEGLRAQKIGTRASRDARVSELLALVGLREALRNRYPFELSGGQRQRVGIARALAANPKFIIADEPISALDVSIQAQIVNLLDDLKPRLGLTYLFVGHDLSMIRYLSDRVAVMYLGRIVEIGTTKAVFGAPLHPYTRALLSAIPEPDPKAGGTRRRIVLGGGVPDPSKPPPGCHFHPRCPLATEICTKVDPARRDFGSAGTGQHLVACHHAGEATL
ncbi:ABC transporter ATP-binding protein [Mesorhizobium sp. M8A.F.Ca.ET.207.01.1.1]|uniref:ABC transporter ATP-binding protein n=4 Tax=unclassified Mesorhizobium TaxID=325217 RepID=UPI00109C2DD3|nr:ABC transporter ATP-binding protein [Mesorhizobium sp. M8A.F.Ca.ET.207.01.1.1]TGQ77722.1 ABC transporter ATP-binding protein [Mesorhizobium sp. M8A.F.Ca.ET.207.01.1.1]